jgi:hypothetical protein
MAAGPAVLMFEAHISERRLASFFGRSMAYGEGTAFVAHVLCELAYVGDPSRPGHPEEGHLTVHHEPGSDTLFVVWDLSHYWDGAMDSIRPVLEILAREMEPTAVGVGAIGGLLSGEGYESMRIEKGTLIRSPEGDIPELNRLWDRHWALVPNEEYPEAATKAEERVDLLCEGLRAAWPSYIEWRDEKRRPAQIAAATEADPLCLVDDVYYWDGQVVARHVWPTRQDIPFPGADPLTFRLVAKFYVDKNYVWTRRLAAGSPPASREVVYPWDDEGVRHRVANEDAIWEYAPVPGAVASDFTYFDHFRYWTDRRRIYTRASDGELVALPDVEASEFRTYGQYFATDDKAVFYELARLPLRVDRLQTDGAFIWADEKVFFKDFEVPLTGASFRILGKEGDNVRIADAQRTLILVPGNDSRPTKLIKG